jgi:murein DD-endopeptidase MepM/ murein hydrolase activator NlpD
MMKPRMNVSGNMTIIKYIILPILIAISPAMLLMCQASEMGAQNILDAYMATNRTSSNFQRLNATLTFEDAQNILATLFQERERTPTADQRVRFVTPVKASDGTASAGTVVTSHPFVTRDYAASPNHWGIDIASAGGANVRLYAIHDGEVRQAAYVSGGAGNQLVIFVPEHRLTIVYMHMHSFCPDLLEAMAANSNRVPIKAGDFVGLMGSTGGGTGVHLHLELRTEQTPTHAIQLPTIQRTGRAHFYADPLDVRFFSWDQTDMPQGLINYAGRDENRRWPGDLIRGDNFVGWRSSFSG